jgi:hypothetical protein
LDHKAFIHILIEGQDEIGGALLLPPEAFGICRRIY